MIKKDGVFDLVRHQYTLRKLSGVDIIDGNITVNRIKLGEVQPGRVLSEQVKETLPEIKIARIKASHFRTMANAAMRVDDDSDGVGLENSSLNRSGNLKVWNSNILRLNIVQNVYHCITLVIDLGDEYMMFIGSFLGFSDTLSKFIAKVPRSVNPQFIVVIRPCSFL